MFEQILMDIIVACIVAVVGVVIRYAVPYANTSITNMKNEMLRMMVENALSWVENKLNGYPSEMKFNKACELVKKATTKLHIKMDDEDIAVLVEGIFNASDGVLVNIHKDEAIEEE